MLQRNLKVSASVSPNLQPRSFNTVLSHQILIMAAIRDAEYGGIAVDSIVLSPECQVSSGETLPHVRSKHIVTHAHRKDAVVDMSVCVQ